MTSAPVRLGDMRRMVNREIEAAGGKGHGKNKWTRWVNAGIVPTWTDPDTGCRYCVPEKVFEALRNLAANGARVDREAS